MSKSVNEYYSEKMKKLLEMQREENRQGQLSSPVKNRDAEKPVRQPDKMDGRRYYERFRQGADTKPPQRPSVPTQSTRRVKNPMERTPVDDMREGRPLRKSIRYEGVRIPENKSGQAAKKEQVRKPNVNPEQTAREKIEQAQKQAQAIQTAKRARMLRNVRDAFISFGLTFAVLVVFLVVVYRLLFVITDISAVGASINSSEELLLASGVAKGDHLYSFSSKDIGNLMALRCPEIESVDVERTPPGRIVFNVVEKDAAFYADFYGEYRLMSPTLRVMDSVTEEDARKKGCIKLKLPGVSRVTSGLVPEFRDVRDDSYIYELCEAVQESALADRVTSANLVDKFNIKIAVDGKYIIKLGDIDSIDIKLKIANAVLEDNMFDKDIKATIDVTDLSETSVVVDEGLLVE